MKVKPMQSPLDWRGTLAAACCRAPWDRLDFSKTSFTSLDVKDPHRAEDSWLAVWFSCTSLGWLIMCVVVVISLFCDDTNTTMWAVFKSCDYAMIFLPTHVQSTELETYQSYLLIRTIKLAKSSCNSWTGGDFDLVTSLHNHGLQRFCVVSAFATNIFQDQNFW